MKKMWFVWVLAIVITLVAAVYQKMTGPTYEKKTKVALNGKTYKLKLPRSNGQSDCKIELPINDPQVTCVLYFDSLGQNGPYGAIKFNQEGENLVAFIPRHDPAAKLVYYLEFSDNKGNIIPVFKDENIKIRFKGDVPAGILIPHIFFIFFAMLLSNLTGILAIQGNNKFRFYGILTLIFLVIGGGIFGPLVQKYAFGELWTGIPFGWDLTDNKTLYAFIFWLVAVIGNWKKQRPALSILAAIMMLVVFSIPHSLFGSTLNYNTGAVGQG